MVVGGMEEDGCVWWDVEDSWELKEINKKLFQMNWRRIPVSKRQESKKG
jgi:hypothetical protein